VIFEPSSLEDRPSAIVTETEPESRFTAALSGRMCPHVSATDCDKLHEVSQSRVATLLVRATFDLPTRAPERG
jgi:hypothetical protein